MLTNFACDDNIACKESRMREACSAVKLPPYISYGVYPVPCISHNNFIAIIQSSTSVNDPFQCQRSPHPTPLWPFTRSGQVPASTAHSFAPHLAFAAPPVIPLCDSFSLKIVGDKKLYGCNNCSFFHQRNTIRLYKRLIFDGLVVMISACQAFWLTSAGDRGSIPRRRVPISLLFCLWRCSGGGGWSLGVYEAWEHKTQH